MIVGLKRRRKSKSFYELAVVDRIYDKTCKITEFRKSGNKELVDYRYRSVTLKTFNPVQCGGHYKYLTYWVYKSPDLIEKICDEDEPSSCKNDSCPHRFRCLTTRVDINNKNYDHQRI